jgi:hypothetical protein
MVSRSTLRLDFLISATLQLLVIELGDYPFF